ncbi:MAG: replication initiation protein, partial [Candidatus Caenarcaniphilales bacterium]|nr:replication initiation protein [Candidatus Caenarcaniphilales bacterium]
MSSENATLVTQSNALVSASYHITLAEKRIILFMLSQIQKDDGDFKPYRMNIKDFVEEFGTKSKNTYERAKVATEQLMSRILQIRQSKGLLQISFLSSAEYEDGKGYVELSFDPKLKPFLLQLKECFTTYDIRNVMALKSFHSIRIYELLKQFEAIGERTITIDELKYMLGLEEQYTSYNLFKKRVILQAQKDLEDNTDLTFEFEEIKNSRRVSKIKFFIKRKQKQLTETSNQGLVKELIDLGIERNQALKYVQIKDIEFLKE